MISALTGELRSVDEGRVHVQCGPILYELLIPAADLAELQPNVGTELTFHTVFYLEGDAARGNLEPRLIGFLRAEDRKFFDLFTTVKGIGPKTALRALSSPVGEIAQAIESKDTRYLVGLQGIGKRTAELIVAELGGKAKAFVSAIDGGGRASVASAGYSKRLQPEEDAIELIIAGGERRAEAEMLLDRAKRENPKLSKTEELWQEMLRLRG